MDPSVCIIGLPLPKNTKLTSLFYINNNKYKMFEWSLHLKGPCVWTWIGGKQQTKNI